MAKFFKTVPPLNARAPMVNTQDGTPTAQFMRFWQDLFQNGEALPDIDAEIIALQEDKADKTITVTAEAPLTGGGTLAADFSLGLDISGVTPDTYGDATNVAQITIDEFGRVTSAVDVPIASGGVGTVTSVDIASTNLTVSGGPITSAGTLNVDLPATAVTPGSYTNTDLTVDAEGRITAASNGSGGGSVTSVNGQTGVVVLDTDDVAEGSTNLYFTNARAVSALTATLANYALLASPAFTGTPTAPTAAPGTNTTQLATTAFVTAAVAALSSVYLTIATAAATYTPLTRTLTAGTGLSGGGDFSANRTFNLANTAVTAGAYTSANITIDAQGRITAAANGSGGVTSVNAKTGVVVLTTDDISEGSTNLYFTNARAVSALTATLANYALLASPTFTGTPAAPTATAGTSTTQLATTAFVTTADNLKANLASPALTGTPTAPTAAPGTNTTQLATTAFVTAAVPATTDNLAEGSTNLYFTNARAVSALTATLANYLPLTGGTLSGNLNVGNGTTSALTTVNGAAGTIRDFQISTNGVARWRMRGNAVAETGSNAGTLFVLQAVDDAGSSLGNVFNVARATRYMTVEAGLAAPTMSPGDNSVNVATTAFVTAAVPATTDNLAEGSTNLYFTNARAVSALTATLANYALLASPAFTGTPTAPTAAPGTNTTQLATTAFVTTADNLKANLASPALTGTPVAPTAAPGTNTTQLATTAFVTAAVAAGGSGAFGPTSVTTNGVATTKTLVVSQHVIFPANVSLAVTFPSSPANLNTVSMVATGTLTGFAYFSGTTVTNPPTLVELNAHTPLRFVYTTSTGAWERF